MDFAGRALNGRVRIDLAEPAGGSLEAARELLREVRELAGALRA